MIDIDKQIEYFSNLTYNEKRAHLLNMLEKIKDKHQVFSTSYDTISTVQNIAESDMISTYKLIFEVSNWLENNKKATEKEMVQKIGSYIDRLHEQERIIREREQKEIEELLENI